MANARLLERLLPAMAAEAGISVAELRELMIPVDMDTTADVSSAEDDVSDVEIDADDGAASPPAPIASPLRVSGGSHAERVRAVNKSPTCHGLTPHPAPRLLRRAALHGPLGRGRLPSSSPTPLLLDPVLEHYASYVFEYPEHCAVWNEELQPFIRSFHRQRRAYAACDLLAGILIAVRRCHANANETQTLAMAQRTTGLPTAATDSSLISKVTAPRVPSGECWESVREDQTRVFPLLTW